MNATMTRLAFLVFALAGFAGPGVSALPVITDVVETGGDDEATDTVTAKFTGQTFSNGIAGEFQNPYTVPFFGEDVPHMVDRTHQHNGASTTLPLPKYLVGGEYIMIGNDNRDNPDFMLEVTIADDADVYLLIDNRRGDANGANPPDLETGMTWVLEQGWEPVRNGLNRRNNPEEPDETGVDEGADGVGPGVGINQWHSVYRKRVTAGTFTLYQADNAGNNMYGVVVRGVSRVPYVSAASGDLLGVVFEVSDGSRSKLKRDSVRLTLDGLDVSNQLQITAAGDRSTLKHFPVAPLPSGSSHTAVLTFTDDAASPQSFTETLSFVVETYTTLTAAQAVPASAVDLASSGFTLRVVQGRDNAAWPSADLPNSTSRGELQLAGLLVEPSTHLLVPNFAVPGPGPQGTYAAETINLNQEMNPGGNATEIGNFQSTSTPALPDQPIPGIPGTDPDSPGNLDNVAAEVVGYLELPAGLHRLGVNSDDGFRVTAAADPRDPGAVSLGVFSGGRGSSDSLFYVLAEQAGLYPVRLIWYEGGGGANLEFFSVDRADLRAGRKILLNDRADAAGLKSYARPAVNLPPAATVHPFPGSTNVPADTTLRASLQPRGTTPSNIQLKVDGASVAAVIVTADGNTLVEHGRTNLWPAGATVDAELSYGDSAGNNTVIRWQFTVENHAVLPVIPASFALAPGLVNQASSGFNVDMYQMDNGTGLPAARTGFPDNNSPEAAERQIARGFVDPNTGEPYPNFAVPGGNADGTHALDFFINWNQQIANAGDFHAGNGFEDAIVPGISEPGDTTLNDWIVAEAVGFLELRKGRHRLGVNSDDGFSVRVGANPRDVIGVQLGSFDTGRGAANTFFDFLVEQDGIYPVRLLWWDGTGGGSVEFKSQDPFSEGQSLVNDRSRAFRIMAYRTLTGALPARIAAVSPAAGATDVGFADPISVDLEDLGATPAQISVNGAPVTAERAVSGRITTLKYTPATPFAPGSTVRASVTRAGGTSFWSFTVRNAPAVAITLPADGTRFPTGPTNFTVAASAAVVGATITKVEFFDGAGLKLGEAATAPYQVEVSGVLPGRQTLIARATDSRGVSGESAPARIQVGTPIAVNFQDATAEPPEGYLPDYGDVFDDRGNGYRYGWDLDNLANARNRNDARSPDERYDTFNHWQKPQPAGSLWEIEVPNGQYHVFAVAGEASNIDSLYDVQAEGVPVVKGTPTDTVRWYEGMARVAVADGRLSIGNGPTAANNKVCFVEIYALPAITSPPLIALPTVSGNTLTVTWTNGGTLESAPAANGPWTSTGDSDGSYSEPIEAAAKFFRVRR